jgi:hypothetical protein
MYLFINGVPVTAAAGEAGGVNQQELLLTALQQGNYACFQLRNIQHSASNNNNNHGQNSIINHTEQQQQLELKLQELQQ